MKNLSEIFKSAEYNEISDYLKKADRWDLATKLIDLIGLVCEYKDNIMLDILKSK